MNETQLTEKKEEQDIPWLPQPGEPLKSYYAFERFLLLGPGRSIAETAKIFKLSRNTIAKYADEWAWDARALLYDKVQYELHSKDALSQAAKNRDKLLSLRAEISELSYNALAQLILILKDFSTASDDPKILKKIKFLFHVSRTVDKLLPLAQVPIDAQVLNITSISDINFIKSFTNNDFTDDFLSTEITTAQNRIEIEKSHSLIIEQNKNNTQLIAQSLPVKSLSSVSKVSPAVIKSKK
ncbi:MAG: hypothetical protein HZB41_08170 [Ignavibacteriae bacterium]|nr:hypothetical protein [Ignavibacteriota bacterium]